MNETPQSRPLDENAMTLRDLGAALRRHAGLFFGVAIGVLALVGVITVIIPPAYESEAVLRIKDEQSGGGLLGKLGSMGGLGDLADLGGLSRGDVDTEMGIIRSRRLAEAVVDSVALHLELESPERPRTRVLQVVRAGRDAERGVYTLERREDGGYSVSASKLRRPVRMPERVELGTPFRLGEMTLALNPALADDPPETIRFRVRSFQREVEDFREDLKVDQQEGGSQLIEVSYRHRDPRIAAAVVNGIVERYMDYSLQTGQSDSRRRAGILRQQVAEQGRQLREAEARLQAYQEQERIIAPEAQAEKEVRRFAEVQVARDALVVERQSLATLLNRVRAVEARPGAQSPYRQLVTFPSFIANSGVQDYLQTLAELENARAELMARRTDQSIDVRALDARIAQVEEQLHQLASGYLESLEGSIASANQTLARFSGELEQIPAKEIEFARRAREQKLLSEVYLMLQAQLRQAEVDEAIDDGVARVIDRGVVAEKPAFPKPWVNLVLGAVLGLMFGFMAVVGRSMADTNVHSWRDAESAAPGVPVVGVVPHFESHRANGARSGRWIRVDRLRLGRAERAPEEALVVRRDPWSPAAEAYRALGSGLAHPAGSGTPRVLVVTSPLAGDGKTTVAANLALALARQGRRVLLVDADLRHGSLHRVFGVDASPGMTHRISDDLPLDSVIRSVGDESTGPPLHLLPRGESGIHPAELLVPERMRKLVAELGDRYDVVVFDTPPLEVASDAAVLGALADGTLLVARSGTTGKEALERAAGQLRQMRAPVHGVVLNDLAAEAHEARSYAIDRNGAA